MNRWTRLTARVVIVSGVLLTVSGVGSAQPPGLPDEANPANTGALTFTGGFDIPSVYVFRGIVQETDPSFTLTPYGDLLITFTRGSDGRPVVAADVGVWNSLQTGSSGTKGPSARLHYAENFHSALWLALPARLTLGAGFTAYTSPNSMFNTITEMSVEVSHADWFRPRVLVAFELDDHGQADNGAKKGTYGEAGVSPGLSLGSRLRVSVPARIGFSLGNYYELAGTDHQFGYGQVGGLVTWRVAPPGRFGAWDVRGGVDAYVFGDTPRAFNQGERTKAVGSVGLAVRY
jgi:hypothetical protein